MNIVIPQKIYTAFPPTNVDSTKKVGVFFRFAPAKNISPTASGPSFKQAIPRAEAAKNAINSITSEFVRTLEKLDIPSFIEATKEFALKALCIPKEFTPQIILKKDHKTALTYVFSGNFIIIKDGLQLPDKGALFGLLMHEFTHQRQFIDMLRTEKLGSQIIEDQAKDAAHRVTRPYFEKYKNITPKELEQIKDKLTSMYPIIKRYISAPTEQAKEEIIKETELKTYNDIIKQLKIYQQKCIQKFGLIRSTSSTAQKNKRMYQEIINLIKKQLKGLEAKKASIAEQEAYETGDLFQKRYYDVLK